MPSPHYFTEHNGHKIAINAENKRAEWEDSAVHAAVAAAVSSSRNSRSNFVTTPPPFDDRTNPSTGEDFFSTPVRNNRKPINSRLSGTQYSAMKDKDAQSKGPGKVSNLAGGIFIHPCQKLVSASATPTPRRVPGSPIVRSASRGKDTSTTQPVNNGTNTKSNGTPRSENKTNVPRHNLFRYGSRGDDSKNVNMKDNKNMKDFLANHIESDDATHSSTSSTTSDETSSCSSSSAGSGNSKPYRNIDFRVIRDVESTSNYQGGCKQNEKEMEAGFSSSATAAAALIGLQQMTVDQHDKTGSSTKRPIMIEKPRDNDVISGRGNGANRRPGNIRFREIVTKYKDVYLYAKAADKKMIARNVVKEVEAMNPPARFLHQDEKTGMWTVLDRRKTLRKVAQALREPSLRKFHESSKSSVSSSMPGQKSPDVISDFSGEVRNEPPSISLSTSATENGTRHKRILFRASNESNTTSDVRKKSRSEHSENVIIHHDGNVGLMKFQEVPVSYQTSSQDMIYTTAQPLAGLTFAVAGTKNPNPFAKGVNMVHSINTQGPFAGYLGGEGTYFDKANHRVTSSQFLGRSDISIPYFLNYRTMSVVTSSPSSLTTTPTQKKPRGKAENDHAETLKNISIVASVCSDLTALYLIVRTGSEAFTGISFAAPSQNVKPTQYDVLINASDIHNHPGNFNLAEAVQLSYTDYMNADLAGNMKSKIVNYVISSVTRENDYPSPEDKRRGRFLLHCNPQAKTNSSPSEAWMVLPKKKVAAIVESLLQQACAFILHPDTNDVLFDRHDVSMLSPGNMYFKSIIEKCQSAYMQASPEHKLNYAVEIVGIVTARPGRFLGDIEEMGMWVPLSFDSAIEKTQKHLSGNGFD